SDRGAPVERVKSRKNREKEYKNRKEKNNCPGFFSFGFKNFKIKNIIKAEIIKYSATGCRIGPSGQIIPQGKEVSAP
ncbi:unnamed protein product, partial [marine sediment metagenome]